MLNGLVKKSAVDCFQIRAVSHQRFVNRFGGDEMNKELSEVLLDFYQKILAPEFASIQKKQAAHDEKFIDIIGHFDDLYKHLEKLEEEYQMITLGMKRIEDRLKGSQFPREDIESKLKELKMQFLHMQSRLEAIEREITTKGSCS